MMAAAKIIQSHDEILDLMRDPVSYVVISAGGRDKGPVIRGRQVRETESDSVQYEADKRPHPVSRTIDPLRDLHRRKVIDDNQLSVGIRFQDGFDNAHFFGAPGMRFDGLPASGRVSSDGGRTDYSVDARRTTLDALGAVGGYTSTGGIALWHLIGLRMSFRELARDRGDHLSMWKGALLVALGSLAVHYESLGYERRKTTK